MNEPANEKIWEGMHHAFTLALEQSRKSLPHRGLLTMDEDYRHEHVRDFLGRWHELTLLDVSVSPRFLTLLLEAQTGPDTDLRSAYRECIAMLLDTLYNEQDEQEDCVRELEQTRGKLREARREQVEIKDGVVSIAANMDKIIDGLEVLRAFFSVPIDVSGARGDSAEGAQ